LSTIAVPAASEPTYELRRSARTLISHAVKFKKDSLLSEPQGDNLIVKNRLDNARQSP
jgi:hypothetical protein